MDTNSERDDHSRSIELGRIFGDDDPKQLNDNVMPRQTPPTANKRPRGRPRKLTYDWARNPPKWPDDLEPPEPNITEELLQQDKLYHEKYRREKASDAMRAAYESGGKTNNAIQENAKQRLMKTIAIEHEAPISNLRRTCSAVAGQIIKDRKNHGLSKRTLRAYVSSIRKVGKAT